MWTVKMALRTLACGVLIAAGGGLFPSYAAERAKAPPKSTVTLEAKLIVFSVADGDVKLEGDVHVTRSVGGQVMSVYCDRMTAKVKGGKMQSVLATGAVRVNTAEQNATAVRAVFDFEKSIITLYGDEKGEAAVTAEGMTSTGPKIVFYMNEQRVELPDGGTTVINIEDSPESKDERDGKGD